MIMLYQVRTSTHKQATFLQTVFFFFILFNFAPQINFVTAQTRIDTVTLRNVLQGSPVVFEGQVESICPYKDPNTGIIYSNNLVHITKTIKGILQCGTVSVLTVGGHYQDKVLNVSHTTEFKEGASGIFVCKLSNIMDPVGCTSPTNPVSLELIFSEHATLEYSNDLINELASGYGSKFNDIQDLYHFIEQVAGFSITVCDPHFDPRRWSNNNYQSQIQKVDTLKSAASLLAGKQLVYSFNSLNITGSDTNSDPKSFELNIRVNSKDDSTYLDKATFRFNYDPQVFGTNPIVSVAMGNDFPPNIYYTNTQRINDTIYEISISAFYNPNSRTNIQKDILKTLAKVKIRMQDCARPYKIRLDSFPEILLGCLYTQTSTALSNTRISYTNVSIPLTRQGAMCIPEIIDFSSTTNNQRNVSGGTKQQIQITGKHFLSALGKIFLPNADDGGNTFVSLDLYDINQWNDTSIIFTVPSRIDSAYQDSLFRYEVKTAGS